MPDVYTVLIGIAYAVCVVLGCLLFYRGIQHLRSSPSRNTTQGTEVENF
jgi:hypothetical protein